MAVDPHNASGQVRSHNGSHGSSTHSAADDLPEGVIAKEYFEFARELPNVDLVELTNLCSDTTIWDRHTLFSVAVTGTNGEPQLDFRKFATQHISRHQAVTFPAPFVLDEFFRAGTQFLWRYGVFDLPGLSALEVREKLFISLRLHPYVVWNLYCYYQKPKRRYEELELGRWIMRSVRFADASIPDQWEQLRSWNLTNPFQKPTMEDGTLVFSAPIGMFILVELPGVGTEGQ